MYLGVQSAWMQVKSIAGIMENLAEEMHTDNRKMRDLWHLEDRFFSSPCELYHDLAQLPPLFRNLAHKLRRRAVGDMEISSGGHPSLCRHQVEAAKLCSEICGDFLAEDRKSQEDSLERVPLRPVSDLLSQLQGQLRSNEAFSEAIQGPKLCKMLEDILIKHPNGTFRPESEELALHFKTYVQEMWEALHKDSNSAAVLMDGFKQEEQKFMNDARNGSETLDTDECFADRFKREGKRTVVMLRLMEMYAAKLDAVLGRDSMDALLGPAREQFSREHRESQKQRQELQEKHHGLADLALHRMHMLNELLAREEHLLAAATVEAEKSAMATKSTLAELMSTIEQAFRNLETVIAADMAARSKRTHAKHRVDALREQIATRGVPNPATRNMHQRFAARYAEAFDLKESVAVWLNAAYEGMEAKTRLTVDELRSNLPVDLFRQIAVATETDLQDQTDRIQAAYLETIRRLQKDESDLRYFEYSGADPAEWERKRADIQRHEEAKEWQQEQASELRTKQDQVAKTRSCYISKMKSPELLGIAWSDDSICTARTPSISDDWVRQFFFSARRPLVHLAGSPQLAHPAISGESELEYDNSSSLASYDVLSEARRSATSAPASRLFVNCLVDTAKLLDPKGQPVPVASLQKGSALVNGVVLGSTIPIKPLQCHDLVVVETLEGATYCLTSDHRVAARRTGDTEWSPVAACQVLGMEVLTFAGDGVALQPARVKATTMQTKMCEVTRLILDPEGSLAFLATEGEFGSCPALAIFGETPSDRLIRIDPIRGVIDSVPSASPPAVPEICSDPGPARAPPMRRPVYTKPAGLAVVAGEDLSEGSRGHSQGQCAGFCKYAATHCKFGVGCKKCHVPSCTKVESQRERKQRKQRDSSV
ncbi:unnamed protein product [Prorocentrum cordatum]|uniref:Hint domain-containing protein n=1 Tax=Prorocentrum cordatum TaxID=2364126 RepID=A0ABN9XBA1_9DINO|nr:unnamed protein product [Polarella glacialis]